MTNVTRISVLRAGVFSRGAIVSILITDIRGHSNRTGSCLGLSELINSKDPDGYPANSRACGVYYGCRV